MPTISRPKFLYLLFIGFIILNLFYKLEPVALSQPTSTTITGQVFDEYNGVLQNAVISIINLDTNLEFITHSNSLGIYISTFLPTGNYQITLTFSRV